MCSECQCLGVSQVNNSWRGNNAYEKLGVNLTVVGVAEQKEVMDGWLFLRGIQLKQQNRTVIILVITALFLKDLVVLT